MKNLDDIQKKLLIEFSKLVDKELLLDSVLIPGVVDSFMIVELMNIIDEQICGTDFIINYNNAFSDDKVSIKTILSHFQKSK